MWLQVAINTAKYEAIWVTLFKIMLQFHAASPLFHKWGIQDLITVKCNKHHQLDTSCLWDTHTHTLQEFLQHLITHLPSSTSMSHKTVILIFTATGISSLTSVVILIYYSLVTEFSFLVITSIYTNLYVFVSHWLISEGMWVCWHVHIELCWHSYLHSIFLHFHVSIA
jgi:hypothetical protein